MMGSVPSYNDALLQPADPRLYHDQPAYAGDFQHPPDLGYEQDLAYAPSAEGAVPQQQHHYDQYSPSAPAAEHAAGLYPGAAHGGSFASVGAAFGFHPDLPIQISAQHLPQSPQPLLDAQIPVPAHFPQQQQQQQPRYVPFPFAGLHTLPQPAPQAAWSAQVPDPDLRPGKRARRSQTGEESDEDMAGAAEAAYRPTRLPGACVHCKSLKVKCEFIPGQDTCNRCMSGRKECVVMGRKPRRAPPKREELLSKIRAHEAVIKQQDAEIAALRARLDGTAEPDRAFSQTSAYSQPRSPRVADQAIQAWIDDARASADVSGDLDPSAVSSVDEHERLSAQEESDDDDDDDGDGGADDGAPEPEPLLRPPGKSTRRSPAVGTALSPIGLIASSALRRKARRGSNSSGGGDRSSDVGPANDSYFLPGTSTNPELRWSVRESQPAPLILASSLVSPREVDKLFEIFFERINLSVSLLDPQIYSAQTTFWRSPFLFTVICAVSSRYLIERPDLYPLLMRFAKTEAGQALVTGLKSPELVAGYILLSLYPVPSARWEEDRGWLMLGVAIRMATDLNLHHSSTAKITNDQQAREVANRTRIWINCYNLDRSTSTQFGKPSTIKEDYIARHTTFWYRTTGFNYDIHLSGYTQLLRVMARFHDAIYSDPDAPTGLNKAIDFEAVTQKYEQELLDHWDEWEPRFAAESDPDSLHCLYRIELLRLANAYSRLVILSFRFQNAFQNGLGRGDPFLQRCLDTASSVVKIVVENMAPHPFLRTAPDAQFVFASFGSVFLLKLLRPRFATVLDNAQKESIVALVQRLIEVLQSEEVAIDERHTPRLYARFLDGLLESHLTSRRSRSAERRTTASPRSASPRPASPRPASPPSRLAPPQIAEHPFPHPVYRPPIVTPPSPRNSLAVAFADAVSTVSSTVPARSYGDGSHPAPDSVMTDNVAAQGGDDGLLATMRAIANPQFWDDMMMPGFSWTLGEPPGEGLQPLPNTT